jgi:hypothetical protein
MARLIHYQPAAKAPRCDFFRSLGHDARMEVMLAKKGLTTDVERVTCRDCAAYLGEVALKGLEADHA